MCQNLVVPIYEGNKFYNIDPGQQRRLIETSFIQKERETAERKISGWTG